MKHWFSISYTLVKLSAAGNFSCDISHSVKQWLRVCVCSVDHCIKLLNVWTDSLCEVYCTLMLVDADSRTRLASALLDMFSQFGATQIRNAAVSGHWLYYFVITALSYTRMQCTHSFLTVAVWCDFSALTHLRGLRNDIVSVKVSWQQSPVVVLVTLLWHQAKPMISLEKPVKLRQKSSVMSSCRHYQIVCQWAVLQLCVSLHYITLRLFIVAK